MNIILRAHPSYVYLADLDGSAFSTSELLFVDAGLSITDSSTYAGFSVIGSGAVESVFGNPFVGSNLNFDLNDGIDAGDSFGILVFDNSTTMASDTFSIFTDASWLLPSDGSTVTFGLSGNDILQIRPGSGSVEVGSISPVPEPSTFALFLASLIMGFVVVRRSRS